MLLLLIFLSLIFRYDNCVEENQVCVLPQKQTKKIKNIFLFDKAQSKDLAKYQSLYCFIAITRWLTMKFHATYLYLLNIGSKLKTQEFTVNTYCLSISRNMF